MLTNLLGGIIQEFDEHSPPSNPTTNQKFTLNGREVLLFPPLQG
jgi:hypothetical protein